MSHPLVAVELETINARLNDLKKLMMPYTTIFGGSVVCGVFGVPLMVGRAWLDDQSLLNTALVGVGLVACGLLCAKLVDRRKRLIYTRIQTDAQKLERAGYVVYVRAVFCGVALDATDSEPPVGARRLEFRSLSMYEFECALEL